ncbi:MAG: ComEC/Rec2 family competence protein, partial [Clostridia bacterium]|nr:ComEC/Rec2 family competence protein [Clostridia bacterium]
MTRPLAVSVAAWLSVVLAGAFLGLRWAIAAAALCAAAALWLFRKRRARFLYRLLFFTLLLAALLATALYEHLSLAPARALVGREAEIEGQVTRVSQGENGFQGAVIRIHRLTAAGERIHIRTSLSIALPDAPPLTPGDRVTLCTTLSFAPDEAGEDWLLRYYRGENILLSAYGGRLIAVTPGRLPLSARLEAYRLSLAGGCGTPLAAALLLGEREGLDEETESLFQTTGTVHMLSFSGMHFTALAAVLTLLLTALGLSRRHTALILMAVVMGIMALMGFSPAVTRAGLAMLILSFGTLIFREADPLTSLAAAALLIAGLRPWVVWSSGFLLSYSAVFGILLTARPLTGLLAALLPPLQEKGWWRGLCGAAAVSLAASLFTAPVLLLLEGEISALSVPANLLTCYPMMALMLLGLLYRLLPLPLLIPLMTALENLCLGILRRLAAIPGGTLSAGSIPVWITVAGLLALVAVCLFDRKKEDELRPAFACGLLLLTAALLTAPLSAKEELLSVTMMDVGQGMSVLVSDGGESILIDCGSESVSD